MVFHDYFVQLRKTKTYNGTEQQLKHVEDVFQLLKALTGDKSFAQAGRLAKFKGGECTMFAVLSEMLKTSEDRGIKLGIELGEERGEDKMAEKVQKALQELIDSQQISKEGAALLQSVTQKTGA